MDRKQLLAQMEVLFRDVLDNNTIVLSDSTIADDIEEWDSLAHVQLIAAIQSQFGIKFTAREMLGWENVGQMVDCILNKL